MSYQTYTTEALVCGTWSKNTSDKSYLLFTKDAGMLYADARSVREEKSKQRFALQEFSHIKVSLVKGKSGWRIGSVEALGNHYTNAHDKLARGSVVGVYRWLRRFLKGEEAMPELYDYVFEALSVLSSDVRERNDLDAVVKLRILTELGYVDRKRVPELVLQSPQSNIDGLTSHQKAVDTLLSHAVNSSQL